MLSKPGAVASEMIRMVVTFFEPSCGAATFDVFLCGMLFVQRHLDHRCLMKLIFALLALKLELLKARPFECIASICFSLSHALFFSSMIL